MLKVMKYFVLLVAFIAGGTDIVYAQLTLDECQKLSQSNYPLIRKYDLIDASTSYSLSSLSKEYLPQVILSGQVTIQNRVPQFPEALSAMLGQQGGNYSGLKKEQYKLGADLNQIIWDGGNVSSRKSELVAQGMVSRSQNDVDMYEVRSRVNSLYFGILLLEEHININRETEQMLGQNCIKLQSMLRNGVAMQSDLDAMRAEYLVVHQQIAGLEAIKKSYVDMLSLFVGTDVNSGLPLQKPTSQLPLSLENSRPELMAFDAMLYRNSIRRKMVDVATMPRLSLFAQSYYGYPGMDYFSDMFGHLGTFNALAGIKVNWNLASLYARKDNIEKIKSDNEIIENSRQLFLFNNRMQAVGQQNDIEKYRKMMSDDDEIISLRKSVRVAAEAKLTNGIINVNDILQEITREKQSRLQRSLHEIEMLRSIYELKHTVNR